MNEIINKSTLLNEYKIVITNYKKALEEKKHYLISKKKKWMLLLKNSIYH